MLHVRSCLLAALASAGTLFAPPLRAAPPSGFIQAADDGITVHGAWARASAGAATTGGAYVTLMGGARADSLVSVSTPIAATAEVHETTEAKGIMRMRAVTAVPIPPGQMVTFKPGGYHIMLMDLTHPLVAGQSFPLTLTFANAAPITVNVTIRPLGRDAPMGGRDHMKM